MMRKTLLAAVLATGLGVGGAGTALAHGSGGQTPGYGMMGPGMMTPQAMPCPGMAGAGMHPWMMMGHGMMGHGMMMPQAMPHPGMMGHGMMMPQAMPHPGMMGPGMMMPQAMPHPGMMGHGMHPWMMMGPGMMGPGPMMAPGAQGGGMGRGMMTAPGSGMRYGGQADLSVEDVRTRLERWLAWQGNPRLALGEVQEESEDSVVADIVTQDGSLVDRLRIDRHTGVMQRVQ